MSDLLENAIKCAMKAVGTVDHIPGPLPREPLRELFGPAHMKNVITKFKAIDDKARGQKRKIVVLDVFSMKSKRFSSVQ